MSILIVNPNSTKEMTNSVKSLVESSGVAGTLTIEWFTSPAPSPASINDTDTMNLSVEHTLPHLLPKLADYNGFLIACYSAHPLVPLLKARTSKPVLGIFEASITTSLLLLRPGEKWGIVSTGDVWKELLSSGVDEFLGTKPRHFVGVATTGLNATELYSASPDIVRSRMKKATRDLIEWTRKDGAELGVVCLGCAGMAGLAELVRDTCIEEMGQEKGANVRIVDGVEAGVGILAVLLKY